MGLDWNPANKPSPGMEAEYRRLWEIMQEENSEEPTEASERFFEISISAFETLRVPTVGIDEVANNWALATYNENGVTEPYDEWFEKVRGLRNVYLVGDCPGIPRYSNGSIAGYVEPFSFRAKFLELCENIIGSETLEQCYENMEPEDLLTFGALLRAKAEAYARENSVRVPPASEEFDEESAEWQVDIVLAAADWCKFWGDKGHPLHAYW